MAFNGTSLVIYAQLLGGCVEGRLVGIWITTLISMRRKLSNVRVNLLSFYWQIGGDNVTFIATICYGNIVVTLLISLVVLVTPAKRRKSREN